MYSHKITKLIKEKLYLEGSDITIKTFPIIALEMLRDIFDINLNAILIDFGPEITEIILIKNSYIEEISTFNKGRNIFVKRVASVLNIEFEEAESMLKMHKSKTLNTITETKITSIIEEAKKDWGEGFDKILKSIEKISQDIKKNKAKKKERTKKSPK